MKINRDLFCISLNLRYLCAKMILVFGGTTEGRMAVEVLEEAGTPYYYSTKTEEQDVALHHGIRLHGALDHQAMVAFCREHDIRLLVDAAHPFAQQMPARHCRRCGRGVATACHPL